MPEKVSFKLDPQLRELMARVMNDSGMSISQTCRILITLGAAREDELTRAFKAACFREAHMSGIAHMRKKFEAFIANTISGLGDPE